MNDSYIKHILINPEVLEGLDKWAAKNIEKKRSAILLGDWSILDGRYVITIQAWIKAKHTQYRKGTVIFTERTLKHAQRMQQAKYPSLKVIGWYRTNPGADVIFDKPDRLIHEKFFNEEWQVAVISDPLLLKTSCFAWYNRRILPSKMKIISDANPLKINTSSWRTTLNAKAISILAAAVIILVGFFVVMKLKNPEQQINEVNIAEVFEEISVPFEEKEVKLIPDTNSEVLNNADTNEPKIDAEEITIDEQPRVKSEVLSDDEQPLTAISQETEDDNDNFSEERIFWFKLLVMKGDTLDSLMSRTGTHAYKSEIIERNGLTNPNQIFPGQELEFPVIYK